MHSFKYKHHQLYCEDVSVKAIAEAAGTPVYIYSHQTLIDHYTKLMQAFKPVAPMICFSMKANSNLAVLRALVNAGAGLDAVSGGELYKALRVGCEPSKVVFASVGKTEAEIREALRVGILLFNVESAQELETIERIAAHMNKKAPVALRINPGVEAHTHAHITTGGHGHKFGIDIAAAEALIRGRAQFPHVQIKGLHLHIGSQILEAKPFLEALEKVSGLIARSAALGAPIEYLDIGGGLGIIYREDDKPQTAKEFAQAVLPLLKKLQVKIILEPGRFIAGNAGILVARVLYLKESPRKTFVVLDAGMNDLIRPALYGAYHEIQPVVQDPHASGTMTADIVGPVCETGDAFASDRKLPPVKSGDLVAIMSAGAYGFSMASHYNSRPNPAEVLVRGEHHYIVRRREKPQDLIRHEVIPQELWTS